MSELGENASQPQQSEENKISAEDQARFRRRKDYAKGLDRRFSVRPDGTPLTDDELPNVITAARVEALDTLTDLLEDKLHGVDVNDERFEQATTLLVRAQGEEFKRDKGPAEKAEQINKLDAFLRKNHIPTSISNTSLLLDLPSSVRALGGDKTPSDNTDTTA